MRYTASEKLEIIRLVERSHLPMRRTPQQIGVPHATFYRWGIEYAAIRQAVYNLAGKACPFDAKGAAQGTRDLAG